MNIYMLLFISFILLFMAGYAFYNAFKKYEENDDFTGGINTFTIVEFIFSILLLISEKVFPEKYHILIFKVFSVLFGLFMLALTVFLWGLFF
jgi:nitrogen fixation-related uncharacterized protein